MDYTQQPKEEIIGPMPEIPDVFKFSGGRLGVFEYQDPSTLNQGAPVQNTWYDIINETNARVYSVAANVEDTNETLEVRSIIDGVTSGAGSIGAINSTEYRVRWSYSAIARTVSMALIAESADQAVRRGAYLAEGKHVRIQVRKTTATGVGNLTGVAQWGKLADAR